MVTLQLIMHCMVRLADHYIHGNNDYYMAAMTTVYMHMVILHDMISGMMTILMAVHIMHNLYNNYIPISLSSNMPCSYGDHIHRNIITSKS